MIQTMAFFQLTLKARRLEQMKLLYQDEKMRSIEVSKGAKIHYTFRQKIRHKRKLLTLRLKNWLKSLTSCPEDSWFHEKAVLIRTDGTFENYILKSVLGFLGGIFLTYMFFMFFIFQLNFTLSSATLFSSFLGIILTIGLAFSNRVRCVVFLLLPQFFSKRGRQALMAYAFILALTGPAKNTLHNMGVLSESLACGQEQLKAAVRAIIDLIKEPFYALRDAIAKVMKSLKKVVKKIKRALLAIKRIVLSILKVIKAVFQWLGSIMNMCNKKLGTPFERCEKVFDGAVADCKASLGPFFGGICNLAYVAGLLCWIVKPFDLICMLVSFISDSIVDVVRRKINKFTKHVKAMFYVKVKFSHSFHFETNQSKSIDEVATGIVTEIRSKTDRFLTVFDWMSFVTTLFFLFMMLRVIYYRNKWLTSERFDNRYLTDDLREIDLRRARLDKETVLPLNRRERNKYIPLTSIVLIKSEKIKLTKSAVFLCLMTFKLGIHMMADYSLYWVLSTIRYHGRFESKVETPNSVGVYVSGTGFLADLYRSIVRAFSPKGTEVNMDTMPCLPDPIPPDLDRYTQIVSLIFLCWIMTIFEPYGLRLRHVVMCYYHPDRARQRAVWLYNHIIRSRGSFMKYARRQLRRKFTKSDKMSTERVTLRERLMAICPILRHCCGAEKAACLLCGAVERDDQSLIKCPKPTCIGLFCVQCFADIQNRCTICLEPIDYGDLSDISEERDSSDGQEPLPCGQKLIAKLREDALRREHMKTEEGDEDENEEEEEEEEEHEQEEEEDEDEDEEKEEQEDVEEDKDEEDEDEGEEEEDEKGEDGEAEVEEENEKEQKKWVKKEEKALLDDSEEEDYEVNEEEYEEKEEYSDDVADYKELEEEEDADDVADDEGLEEEEKVADHEKRKRENDPLAKKAREEKQLDESESSSSSSTDYSYSYQNESPGDVDVTTQRKPYKDIEAQEVRDDVTLQVFNDSSTDEESPVNEELQDSQVKEKPIDVESTTSASIADTESLPTEEVDEEEIIQEEVSEEHEEESLLPKKRRKRNKKGKGVRKIVAILSRPFSRKGCDPRCAGLSIEKRRSSIFDKIVNVMHTRPKFPVTAFRRHEKSQTDEPMLKLLSSNDLVELDISPRKYASTMSEVGLPKMDRMQKFQHLEEDSVSAGASSRSNISHRRRCKKVRSKTGKKCNVGKTIQGESFTRYPHENTFETKELPRYLESIVAGTKYDEINEVIIHGSTPRSEGTERNYMNKLSGTKTISTTSSARNLWNIRSSDDECDICVCSRGSSLSSLDVVPRSSDKKHDFDMSTIEEGSNEVFLELPQVESDEIVDVTGMSTETFEVNLNGEDKIKKKKSMKRLITTDEEECSSRSNSKRSKRVIDVCMSDEKIGNMSAMKRPWSPSGPELEDGQSGASPSSTIIDVEAMEETIMTNADCGEFRRMRKRRKRSESVGQKPPKKLYDPLAELQLFGNRPELRFKKHQELPKLRMKFENKTEEPKEVTNKEKQLKLIKVVDLSSDEICTQKKAPTKFVEDEKGGDLRKADMSKIQTDSSNLSEERPESLIGTSKQPEPDTSTSELTATDELKMVYETLRQPDSHGNKYKFNSKLRRHRKSPQTRYKERRKHSGSYYTDAEDSSRKRGPESYRSVISDEEISPRRIFASEHRKATPTSSSIHDHGDTSGSPEYFRQLMKSHRNYRSGVYSSPETPGQSSPSYRPGGYSASGDSAHCEDRYNIERRMPPAYRDRFHTLDRHERGLEEEHNLMSHRFSPEGGRMQGVSNLRESDDIRAYDSEEREDQEQYDNHDQNVDHTLDYSDQPINHVTMYDPSSPPPYDTRNLLGAGAIARYPQRYPSPRNYPDGVDPYYGISSFSCNPHVPNIERLPRPEETLQHVPEHSLPLAQSYDHPVTEDTPNTERKGLNNNNRSGFMGLPILRRFLPISQNPKLIFELKEHDRVRLIREREARGQVIENTQLSETPIPSTSGRSQLRENNPTENSRNRLSHQGIEVSNQVLNEYEQRRLLKRPKKVKKRIRGQRNTNVAPQQTDASFDVIELHPPRRQKTDAISKITSNLANNFGLKPKKIKSKTSSSRWVSGPSQIWAEPCQNPIYDNVKKKKTEQGRKRRNDISVPKSSRNQKTQPQNSQTEMSSVDLNRYRRKNRRCKFIASEEDEEDTTDNNETSH